MDYENESKDQLNEQQSSGRDGYQKDYRASGRSPRPRIAYNSPRQQNYERSGYTPRFQRDDDAAFRPEGFGASLQQQREQRPYRARTFNNNSNANYQQRPYSQQGKDYHQRYGQEQQEGDTAFRPRQQYQPRNTFRPRQQDDFQQGGYKPRGTYQPRQQRPFSGNYSPKGTYQQAQHKPYQKRQRTADYDPNAKYSFKKRIEYKEVNFDPNEPIRLNKFLANAGICSRREADEFIQAGVITVNGQVVTELGTKVLRTDSVRFHEQPVSLEKKVYVLLNKPKDYVTTSDDPQQRKTVMDLVKGACPERIYPVGRLDRNTTGVLLLTNDGDLASKLTHPKYLKKKIYHVHLDRNVTAHDMQAIATGVMLDDGEVNADDIQYADANDKKQVGIEIHSGKNRIVRRIFESLGYRVQKLDRVQFAGLTKKNLRRGDWRYLTEEEVDRLRMGAYE